MMIPNSTIPLFARMREQQGLSIRDRAKFLLNKPVDKGLVYEVAYLKPQSKHDPGMLS
jgi:hypothetical protein